MCTMPRPCWPGIQCVSHSVLCTSSVWYRSACWHANTFASGSFLKGAGMDFIITLAMCNLCSNFLVCSIVSKSENAQEKDVQKTNQQGQKTRRCCLYWLIWDQKLHCTCFSLPSCFVIIDTSIHTWEPAYKHWPLSPQQRVWTKPTVSLFVANGYMVL